MILPVTFNHSTTRANSSTWSPPTSPMSFLPSGQRDPSATALPTQSSNLPDDPGVLIPEQRVADAWNDYLQKIGAPQDVYVTAAEIHTLRDTYYVGSQLSWARDNQNIWTVPNIYAIGRDGKVANGCRALEVLNILWGLTDQPEVLQGTRDLIKKGQRLSDMVQESGEASRAGVGEELRHLTARVMPPNPVEQAAIHYMHDHGIGALNTAIEGLLKNLFTS